MKLGCILHRAQQIGWTLVPHAEAARRRGFDPAGATPEERARRASPYVGDLLHAQFRASLLEHTQNG